jgi:indole-3-glycerol phosphate synthase
MPGLENILAATRRETAQRRASADRKQLRRRAEAHAPRGFRRALEKHDGIVVIAELKKASPSKGLIRAQFDPGSLAKELEGAGAAALSVLTDEEFFQGSLENLRLASASVAIPCLRKDFIVDEFQLLEARANCADAVLLIVAALTQQELVALSDGAEELGLDVLCEVHDEAELDRALDAGSTLIGVNNRDLKTFKVDLENSCRLAEKMPRGIVTVAESGISTGADLARLRSVGYNAFLMGESLMKAASPAEALKSFLAGAAAPVSW